MSRPLGPRCRHGRSRPPARRRVAARMGHDVPSFTKSFLRSSAYRHDADLARSAGGVGHDTCRDRPRTSGETIGPAESTFTSRMVSSLRTFRPGWTKCEPTPAPSCSPRSSDSIGTWTSFRCPARPGAPPRPSRKAEPQIPPDGQGDDFRRERVTGEGRTRIGPGVKSKARSHAGSLPDAASGAQTQQCRATRLPRSCSAMYHARHGS